MPVKTFTQVLVERSAPMVADRLWAGSCPLKRPLFRDLAPTTQKLWAQAAQRQGRSLSLSDDPGLSMRAAMAVGVVWDDIDYDFDAAEKEIHLQAARQAIWQRRAEQEAITQWLAAEQIYLWLAAEAAEADEPAEE